MDGYCKETQTIFEYNGCYFHSHYGENYNAVKWAKTLEREKTLKEMGYNVESITSCQWHEDDRSQIWYATDNVPCTMMNIIDAVNSGELFGYAKLSLHVPEHLIPTYSDFPPIYKNTSIELEDIGVLMQKFCEDTGRTSGVKRTLISSMSGEGIVISTALMKKYLQMGLVIDDIDWILDYQPKKCFEWFRDMVINGRRKSDLDHNYAIIGDCLKTLGNAFYGGTLIDRKKHTSVTIVDENKIGNHIKSPMFKTLTELNDHFYEVENQEKQSSITLPFKLVSLYIPMRKFYSLSFGNF